MKSKEYFNYLLYIGVILPEDEAQIKEIIQNETKEKFINNDKNKFIQNLMGDYLASLNKESLIKLGINIYNQYHKNKLITIGKHLTKMTKILQKKIFHETKYYLNKLKKQFTNKENKNNIDKISRSQSSDKLNQYYNNINFNKYTIYNNYYPKLQKEFLERMDKYNTKKENNKKFQELLKEEEINFICTFSPDLSLTKNRNSYNKNIFRNKNYNSIEKIDEEKPIKKVDNNRMTKLYNDYQQQNIKKEKLKDIIDKENGYTFSPKLNKESKYNKKIKDNLYERNKKLLTSRKNFVEGFNLLRDLQMKGLDVNKISIDLSKV